MKALRTFAKALRRAFIRLLKRQIVVVPTPVWVKRCEECNFCQYNRRGICGLCSCVIAAKVHLASESCPDGRWPAL